jgi:hypothetical protein
MVTASLSFICSFIALLNPYKVLDIDIDGGFSDVTSGLSTLLDKLHILDDTERIELSSDWLRFFLALLCAAMSGLFVLPALRFARCYNDLITVQADSVTTLTKLLLRLNFFLPLLGEALRRNTPVTCRSPSASPSVSSSSSSIRILVLVLHPYPLS